jgi:uncharacterized coiled-coil protein SlyX
MDKASEAILALKPVTFRYKPEIDPAGIPQFGLVAEDVEKVNPDLVVRNENGEIYTVRYEAVNAMLLNEFLKEHRKVDEQVRMVQEQKAAIAQLKSTVAKQEATIAQQQSEIKGLAQLKSTVVKQEAAIAALTANLQQQTSEIQKVSAQLAAYSSTPLALSKPASQTAFNNQ